MFRKGNILRICANAAIFILLETAAFNMLRYNNSIQDIWLSKGVHTFIAKIWGGTESVKQYFSLNRQNEELAQKNFELQQVIRRYRHVTGKDYMLDSIPEVIDGFSYIPANIVKISNNKQHNYLIIGKGREDGIMEKSGVITDQGVIGIIDAVGKNFSYARSFKNSGMVVSCRIGREGPSGSVSWDGISSKGAIVKEVPQHIELHPGDTVYTSGYSSIFPPDIPIGTIGTATIENGATYEIKVSLLEDFSRLRYVTVVYNTSKEEITELEKQ